MQAPLIAHVFFPEPGRSPLPERENRIEYDTRNRLIANETGMTIEEWTTELVGQNILDQPVGPSGWTAWSVILVNGEVLVLMLRTKGLLQRRLWNIVADLNDYFSAKIPFTREQAYDQAQRFISFRMRQMCGHNRFS